MKSATMTGFKKEGKKYIVDFVNTDAGDAIERLAGDLAAKYIGKAPFIKSIKRRNNCDGTQLYTVFYDNGYKIEYTVSIY